MKNWKKHTWLFVFLIAAVLCYICYFLTRNVMWMIFGFLFVFTGGMQSIEVKNDEKSKAGGYNVRNRQKAKQYDRKKKI